LCRPASGPKYFSGFDSATETYGLHPQRVLSLTAFQPSCQFSFFVVCRRRVTNYFAATRPFFYVAAK
jgi:hypothetical protein